MKFEFLAFSMIDKPEGHGDLYRQILHLFNNIDLAIERVEEDLGDKISNQPENDVSDAQSSGDAYDFFTGGESAPLSIGVSCQLMSWEKKPQMKCETVFGMPSNQEMP